MKPLDEAEIDWPLRPAPDTADVLFTGNRREDQLHDVAEARAVIEQLIRALAQARLTRQTLTAALDILHENHHAIDLRCGNALETGRRFTGL